MIQRKKEIWKTIYYYMSLMFVFLIAVHFEGYMEKRVFIGVVLMLIYSIVFYRGMELDGGFFVLATAMILHGLLFGRYHQTEYWQNRFNFGAAVLPPLAMYLVCQQGVYKEKQERIELFIFSICIGTFIYSMLNYSVFLQEGFLEGGRIWNEFWTHTPRYATEYSFWGVFIVGLIGYGLYCIAEKKWIRGSIICALIIIENVIQIVVDNRMVLMITVLSAFISVLLYVYFNRNNRKKLLLLLGGMLLVGIIVLVVIVANVGGIRDTTYYNHFFTRDGGILRNVRFQMMWEAILQIPSHWKGGGTMVAAGFTTMHNYWLQVANDTGIFPFALWMIFNLLVLISLIKCVKNQRIHARIKFMIAPLSVAVVSYFMLEMGGHGLSEYIIFYVILAALIRQLEKNERKYNITEGRGNSCEI